jgi:hypothetical protein
MPAEGIPRWFCACEAYADDPGSVVCWRCEQALVEVDPSTTAGALTANLLGLCVAYRQALEKLAEGSCDGLDDDTRDQPCPRCLADDTLRLPR